MLGAQSWFTALAVPMACAGDFIASHKRFAYQWCEELMDPNGTSYPVQTDVGRLRHVSMEYSKSGQFYREPPPTSYRCTVGTAYVIIPLRRDRAPAVLTLPPSLLRRNAAVTEIMAHSWMPGDVDALVPSGAMLRVYGSARCGWGWGVRSRR